MKQNASIKLTRTIGNAKRASALLEALETRTFLSSVTTSFVFDEFPTAGPVPQKNVFEFTDSVAGEFTKSDLTVRDLGSGEPASFLNPSNMELANPAGNTWELKFPGYLYGAVPDGFYETILEKESVAGLTNDGVVDFWFYNGDFNRDTSINIGDFSILGANFNTPQSFTGGDGNYSGTAEIGDFSIVASKFNMHIDAPGTAPGMLWLTGTCNPAMGNPRIRRNWSAEADPNRLGFRIWRSTDGVNFGDVYATVGPNAPYEFDDDNVTEGVHYWYRVRAYSAAGNSATTRKMDMLTPLKAPTNLAMTQIDSAHFEFTAIDHSEVESEFQLYRYPLGGSVLTAVKVNTVPASAGTGGTVHLSDTLPVGTAPQYFYFVLAWNNTSSCPSNIVGTRPSVPQTPTVTYSAAPLSLDLDWADNPEPAVTYNVYRSTAADFDPTLTVQRATGLSSSQFSDTTVSAGTRYYYAITAVQNAVESLASAPATQVTGAHAQPTNLQARADDENSI